ncbi:MAG: transposase [Bacteroidia bacterium]|nr:transposase [Bacteroidia bacterium]
MEDKLFNNKYRIPSARLQTWDYANDGAYFITICTKNRTHYFGEIKNDAMQLSTTGALAAHYWNEIPNHFPMVTLANFIVMPNHVHGIIIINNETRHCLVSTHDGNNNLDKTEGQLRYQNQGKNTVSSIVGSYKSVLTKNARLTNPNFAWQARFYDIIIKDEIAYNNIQHYIANNVLTWANDQLYKYTTV